MVWHAGTETNFEGLFVSFHPLASESRFEGWLEHARTIVVELHPGGRATLTDPDMPWLGVEIRFGGVPLPLIELINGRFHHAGDAKAFGILSYKLTSKDTHIPFVEISLSRFVAALLMKLESITGPPATSRPLRPRSGPGRDIEFYRRVVSLYEELVKEGHPSPYKEIARRYRVPPGTVGAWLTRGRRYLAEQEEFK